MDKISNKPFIVVALALLIALLAVQFWPPSPNGIQNEKDRLKKASSALENGDFETYYALRDEWKPESENPVKWFTLEADRLISQSDKNQAKAWLTSKHFEGSADAPRQVRLAILEFSDDAPTGLALLKVALEADPENPELHAETASLLEREGRLLLAQEEYQKAIQLDPQNAERLNQLAEFYARHKQIPLALLTWQRALSLPSSASILPRLVFWSKVLQPMGIDWHALELPEGPYKNFVEYVLKLPEGQFWDANAWKKIESKNNYETSLSEVFWLKLLQALKDGHTEKALKLISENPFKSSLIRPDLEAAVLLALNYQKDRKTSLKAPFSTRLLSNPSTSLLKQLALWSHHKKDLQKNLKLLLKSPEIFTAIFLDCSWDKAALALNKWEVVPAKYPSWLSYDLARALQRTQGDEASYKFALKQIPTAPLEALIGELEISISQPDGGLKTLLGAREALKQEDLETASQLYRKIENLSTEAKMFLLKLDSIKLAPSTDTE